MYLKALMNAREICSLWIFSNQWMMKVKLLCSELNPSWNFLTFKIGVQIGKEGQLNNLKRVRKLQNEIKNLKAWKNCESNGD
jgi:hypothetical protein